MTHQIKACLTCSLTYTTADEPHTVEQCRDQLVAQLREARRQLGVQTAAHSSWEQRAERRRLERDEARAELERLRREVVR